MSKKVMKLLPAVHQNDRYYTDGSANCKTRLGGWGVYCKMLNGQEWEHCGFQSDTTISRMEMFAMIIALRKGLQEGRIFSVYSDSNIVVSAINLGWLDKWISEGIESRQNSDLWIKIKERLADLRINNVPFRIYHMNGHRKDVDHPHVFGNHVADALCDYKQHPDYGK